MHQNHEKARVSSRGIFHTVDWRERVLVLLSQLASIRGSGSMSADPFGLFGTMSFFNDKSVN